MKDWFKTYGSNTLAGSGNQSFFLTGDDRIHKGRVYYKVFAGGRYQYSLLFSNIIDSTYGDGDSSVCNMICDAWQLLGVSVGVCRTCSPDKAIDPQNVKELTFQGRKSKTVMPGEFFVSDGVEIEARKDEYLCVEATFTGSMNCPKAEKGRRQSIAPNFASI